MCLHCICKLPIKHATQNTLENRIKIQLDFFSAKLNQSLLRANERFQLNIVSDSEVTTDRSSSADLASLLTTVYKRLI